MKDRTSEYTVIVKRIPLSADQCALVRQHGRLDEILRRHLSEMVLGVLGEHARREDEMWDSLWEKTGLDRASRVGHAINVDYLLQEVHVLAKPAMVQSDESA